MVPWVTRFVDPVMATGWHMVIGGLPLAGISALTERDVLAENLQMINAGALPGAQGRRPSWPMMCGLRGHGVWHTSIKDRTATAMHMLVHQQQPFAHLIAIQICLGCR